MTDGREGAPRVSLVLPVRNGGATLAPCLSSIVRQTFTRWECIIVDDGSTDDTCGMARSAMSRDGRFRLVSLPPHGIVRALNEGLRHCRASLIARMDADDVMCRERLALQVDALGRDGRLAAVGCHVRLFPRARMSGRLFEYEAWLNSLRTADDVRRDAFVECPLAHPSLMMRREMAALGYIDSGWPEDYDLLLRALGRGMRLGVVPRRLLSWRDRPDRASRTCAAYRSSRFTACKAHYLAAGFLSGTDTYTLWGYGRTGRSLRRALAVHEKHPTLIVEVKPTRIGNRIHDAPVIPPGALPASARQPIVVSVAREGPRGEIRAALAAMRFIEGDDYVCAA